MKERRNVIIIIGSGNIGRRYIEALTLIKLPIDIYIYDNQIDSLTLAKQTISNIRPSLLKNKNFFFEKKFNKKLKKADLAILSTNSDNRKKVFFNIIKKTNISKFIFEKVLFQNLKDYNLFYDYFKNNKRIGWVNCHYRSHSVFKNIKKEIKNLSNIKIELKGSDWGMGSNSIHFIDLFCYLFNDTNYSMDSSNLINKKYKSKRPGFIEFFGKLKIQNNHGNRMYLIDDKKYHGKMNLIIKNKHFYLNYNFYKKTIKRSVKKNIFTNSYFEIPLLSKSVNIQIHKILKQKNCDLVNILESISIHKPMFKSFLIHIKALYKKEIRKLPIT